MKTTTYSTLALRFLAASLLLAPVAPLSAAATVTSNPFVLYYGYDNSGSNQAAWIEVSGPGSTGTTQGDFTLSSVITSTRVSDYGFVFTNGTPTYYDAGAPTYGQYAFSSHSTTFALDISASYTGTPTPGAGEPQIRFVITNISIWGMAFDNQPGSDLAFSETTAGHEATSDAITVKRLPASAANLRPVDNYTLLQWDPEDFFVSGLTQDRSFTLTPGRIVDGLTIEGYIEVTYEAIPEPSTTALAAISGGAVLMAALRRSRKK